MNPLTKDQEFEVIDNIKKAGKEGDIDVAEVVRGINRMVQNKEYSEPVSDSTMPNEFFNNLHSMSPQKVMDYTKDNLDAIKDVVGKDNYNLDILLKSLNESKVMPYKAMKKKNETTGEEDWDFFKNIEGYELTQDGNKNDVFLRKYNDGTAEPIDKETFEDEKYFRFMPKDIKSKMMVQIDETKMDETEKSKMNSRILDYQAKRFMDQ